MEEPWDSLVPLCPGPWEDKAVLSWAAKSPPCPSPPIAAHTAALWSPVKRSPQSSPLFVGENLQPHPHVVPLIGELCLVRLFIGTLGTKALESKIGKLSSPLDQAQLLVSPSKLRGMQGSARARTRAGTNWSSRNHGKKSRYQRNGFKGGRVRLDIGRNSSL